MPGSSDGGTAKRNEIPPTHDGEALSRSFTGGTHWARLSVGLFDHLVGTAKLQAALTVGNTSATFNSSGTLTGQINPGDTFTITGETGLPVHTVTGGPYVAAANVVGPLTFTPGIATGGAAINAIILAPGTSVYRQAIDAKEATRVGSHTFAASW